MKVRVKFFAFLQEIFGSEEMEIELKDKMTIKDLINELGKKYGEQAIRAIEFGEYMGRKFSILKAVNGEVTSEERELNEGDVVAFIPPPSGGEEKIEVKLIKGNEELDFNDIIISSIRGSELSSGSLGLYMGFVKGLVNGSNVTLLKYQAYEEYTIRAMMRIAKEVKEKFGLDSVKIYHRIAELKPKDIAIVIITIANKRENALEACKELINRVKSETGIWKLEVRNDGEYWVVDGDKRVKSNK
jgi:molybdopterin synthase catalytic subunit